VRREVVDGDAVGWAMMGTIYHARTVVESAFVGNRRGTMYRSRPVGFMAMRSACADKIGKWRCRGGGR